MNMTGDSTATMTLRVLIVDDNENISLLLQEILNMEDHKSTIVGSGDEALQAFHDSSYDLVFCDISLPDISGWDVIRHIRDQQPETKIAVISGLGNNIDAEKLEEFAIRHVVSKPFRINEIQQLLTNMQV